MPTMVIRRNLKFHKNKLFTVTPTIETIEGHKLKIACNVSRLITLISVEQLRLKLVFCHVKITTVPVASHNLIVQPNRAVS